MVANVESMAYFGQTPWHGIGTIIQKEDRFDWKKALELSETDWLVEKQPIFHTMDDGKTYEEVENHMAVRRQTDNRVLGIVGKNYTPLQNEEAFRWFAPLFDNKQVALETAGSLMDGQRVWILAEIQGIDPITVVRNDIVRRYLLLSNSHDGTSAVRVSLNPVRVVCCNTLAMAHANKQARNIRLRHGKDVVANLEEVRDIINFANKEFEATAEKYRFLASKRIINATDLKKFVKVMLKVDEDKNESDLHGKTVSNMERLLHLMVHGRGNDMPGVAGTWWGAYNGFTQLLTWEKGRSPETRLNNLWFSSAINENKKALDLALQLATAA